MSISPEGSALLFGASYGLGAEAVEKLGELIRIFAVQGYRMGLQDSVKTYRGLHSGGCHVLSLGQKCECFLCKIQKKAEAAS